MKTITLSCLIILMSQAYTSAQTAENDTVKVIPNVNSVSVIKEGNNTIIKAMIPTDDNTGSFDQYTYKVSIDNNTHDEAVDADDIMLKLPFIKSKSTEPTRQKNGKWKTQRYITGMKYVYWGWNFNYADKAGIKNCFELSAADFIGLDWRTSRKTTLGVGIGFGYNRVTTNDHMLFVKNGDVLGVAVAPEDAEVDYARWDMLRFQVPLMYSQKLSGNFGFALASIINFNTYSTATNRYKTGRTRYTETIKGINQRLLTVDLMATVGFVGSMGAYIKWSPMTAMQQKYGPSFRNFSIGVNFNF